MRTFFLTRHRFTNRGKKQRMVRLNELCIILPNEHPFDLMKKLKN